MSGSATVCRVCGGPLKRGASQYCSSDCYRIIQRSRPIEDRFWAKVKRGAPTACWPWLGSLIGSAGFQYGQFSLRRDAQGRPTSTYAHRFSWELANGRAIPDGLQILHSCDNPRCVNPAHLSVGTCADNIQDASRKGRLSVPRPRRQKLSTDELKEIDRRLAAGEAKSHIAARYGVSKSWISLYAKGDRRQYDRPTHRAKQGAA